MGLLERQTHFLGNNNKTVVESNLETDHEWKGYSTVAKTDFQVYNIIITHPQRNLSVQPAFMNHVTPVLVIYFACIVFLTGPSYYYLTLS